MSDFRPDLLDTPELPKRIPEISQRWTPATGWRDVAAPPVDADGVDAAAWAHSQHCGAMHPNAGFYCTEDPGHDTSNGHAAKDEFGAVLRRWMGPDAYLDPVHPKEET